MRPQKDRDLCVLGALRASAVASSAAAQLITHSKTAKTVSLKSGVLGGLRLPASRLRFYWAVSAKTANGVLRMCNTGTNPRRPQGADGTREGPTLPAAAGRARPTRPPARCRCAAPRLKTGATESQPGAAGLHSTAEGGWTLTPARRRCHRFRRFDVWVFGRFGVFSLFPVPRSPRRLTTHGLPLTAYSLWLPLGC